MTTILTLSLDPASQSHFEGLRRLHFPPERNQIPAHLTLFHTLPEIQEVLAELTDGASQTAAFAVSVTGLRSLGKGVAFTLASPALQILHTRLATAFEEHLTPQDCQPFRPHIVVQK